MNNAKKKQLNRFRRKHRNRKKGTSDRMRLSVHRSLRSIYAQIIDDQKSITIASASSKELDVKGKNKTEVAVEVGKLLAKKAQEKGVKEVVFDKGPFKYHGRVKALGDAAREAGLEF